MKRLLQMLCLAAALWSLNPAPAGADARDDAVALLSQAKEAYAAGRTDDALRLFRTARELWAFPQIDYSIGQCLMKLGRWQEALETWQKLRDEPELAKVRDKVRANLAECERHLFGTVALSGVPENAKMTLDGAPVPANTSTLQQVTVGRHELQVLHPDYEPRGVSFEAAAGETLNVAVRPVPRWGRIALKGLPDGARVSVDGVEVAATDGLVSQVPGGRHAVAVAHPDYEPWTTLAAVTPGADVALYVTAQPKAPRPTPAPTAPPAPRPAVQATAAPIYVPTNAEAPTRPAARAWYANPWLWVGIGAGAAAAATGIYFLSRNDADGGTSEYRPSAPATARATVTW